MKKDLNQNITPNAERLVVWANRLSILKYFIIIIGVGIGVFSGALAPSLQTNMSVVSGCIIGGAIGFFFGWLASWGVGILQDVLNGFSFIVEEKERVLKNIYLSEMKDDNNE